MKKPGQWSVELETKAGDRSIAERTYLQLCDHLNVQQPQQIVWVETPTRALLAHAYLHHAHGEELFKGDEPRIFRAMLTAHQVWEKTLKDGQYFPNPEWRLLDVGRRLIRRGEIMKDLLVEKAQSWVRGKQPDPVDVKATLQALAADITERDFNDILAQAIEEIGVYAGWSKPLYIRNFKYDAQTWSGDEFTMRAPRCMNFDDIAATVYKVENMSESVPAWWHPLADLTGAAGWVWPFDRIVVFCDRPSESHYAADHKLHCEVGPAIAFTDGSKLFFLEGLQVDETTVMSPQDLTAADIAAEKDLHKKRLMVRRRGLGVLDDPKWPQDLKTLANMVFEQQFYRFTAEDLDGKGQAWPVNSEEPRIDDLKPYGDGCYYTTYEDGQLSMVVRKKGDWIGPVLRLEHGTANAKVVESSFAEQYFADGRVEGFSPYDDDSPPVPTSKTFSLWVRENLDKITR